MDNNNPWLRAEIDQWLREGIISDEQAKILYARYPIMNYGRGGGARTRRRGDGRWGKLIFAALGVSIFGMGIILLFAYNWADMHRYFKLAVIGISILLAHGIGMVLYRTDSQRGLGESLHLLGTILFGAGIWLVAQIYHFDAHYPDGFLLWFVAALSFAWVLPSAAHGILTTALLLLWSGFETFEFQRQLPQTSWILMFLLLPLAWWQRANSLLAIILLSLPLSYVFGGWHFGEQFVMPMLLLLVASYFALARLASRFAYPEAKNVFDSVGSVIWLPLLFIGSFIGIPSQQGISTVAGFGLLYLLMPLLAVLITWLWVVVSSSSRPVDKQSWFECGLVLGVIVLAVVPALVGTDMGGLGRVVFNLAFLGYSVLYVYQGTELGRGKILSLGCVMLSVLAFARFTDMFYSLLARSSVFLLLGVLLFVIGQRYAKQNTRRLLEKPRA
jgi:uncharacterized membrane protein